MPARSFGSVFADLHPGEDLAALREKFDQQGVPAAAGSGDQSLDRAWVFCPQELVAMTLADFAA